MNFVLCLSYTIIKYITFLSRIKINQPLKDSEQILTIAKQTILTESDAIANLTNLIDSNFENAIKFILL